MTHQDKINQKTLTVLGKTTKCAADSHQLLLRSRRCSVLQLLQVACSQLHMPADYTTLLVNGMPLVRGTEGTNVLEFKLGQDYPFWQSIDANNIDDKSVLTVVAKQPVSLRCHHVSNGHFQKTKVVQFQPGKPLGEPWRALHATFCSFLIFHFTMTPSHCGGKGISPSPTVLVQSPPHPDTHRPIPKDTSTDRHQK